MHLLTPEVIDAAGRSVLCWLATVDAAGHPNVSPKEVFAVIDDTHLAIAHIASPGSVRNIRRHPQVCVSFVDIFVQKGFKIRGTAHIVTPEEDAYSQWAGPLEAKAGPRFPIRAVIVVAVQAVEPIVAPSYWLYPETTTEASQIEAAHRTYGVKAG